MNATKTAGTCCTFLLSSCTSDIPQGIASGASNTPMANWTFSKGTDRNSVDAMMGSFSMFNQVYGYIYLVDTSAKLRRTINCEEMLHD